MNLKTNARPSHMMNFKDLCNNSKVKYFDTNQTLYLLCANFAYDLNQYYEVQAGIANGMPMAQSKYFELLDLVQTRGWNSFEVKLSHIPPFLKSIHELTNVSDFEIYTMCAYIINGIEGLEYVKGSKSYIEEYGA